MSSQFHRQASMKDLDDTYVPTDDDMKMKKKNDQTLAKSIRHL